MPRYLIRTRQEHTLEVEAASPEEAVAISQDVDIKEWTAGEWERAEADDIPISYEEEQGT